MDVTIRPLCLSIEILKGVRNVKNNTVYLPDKTKTLKIGKTNFIVSSFVKADGSMTFLKILEKLIEHKLSA